MEMSMNVASIHSHEVALSICIFYYNLYSMCNYMRAFLNIF